MQSALNTWDAFQKRLILFLLIRQNQAVGCFFFSELYNFRVPVEEWLCV